MTEGLRDTLTGADRYCQIFVDGCPDETALTEVCADVVDGTVDGQLVRAHDAELEVGRNPCLKGGEAPEADAPFLAFAHSAELEVSEGQETRSAIALFASLLEAFWAKGWRAVAACSVEEHLPNHGGYRDGMLVLPRSQ